MVSSEVVMKVLSSKAYNTVKDQTETKFAHVCGVLVNVAKKSGTASGNASRDHSRKTSNKPKK